MKYCQMCVQPNTRPGLVFDADGVCSACRAYQEREKADWTGRGAELDQIVYQAKNANAVYDCVVGVSGGKDSHYQALYSRDRLGLNPLLVNCAPDGISDVGRANLENLVQKGFDMISIRPNPIVERALSRYAFFEYGNFVKPLEFPLYASAFRVALNYKIPLVIQGENPAETLGIEGYLKKGGDAMQWKDGPTVAGGGVSDWLTAGVPRKDLFLYEFPDVDELEKAGIRAIFLGHYARYWSNGHNTLFAIKEGLRGRSNHDPKATGRTNSHFSLDADLKVVNQYIKYLKFGFGATTDEVCYDIRDGVITREQGIDLVERYDGCISDQYIYALCQYLDISLADFWTTVDRFVNKHLFCKGKSGDYIKKFVVGEGLV